MEPEFNARFNEDLAFNMEKIALLQEGHMDLQQEHLRLTEGAIRDQEEHMRDMEVQLKRWERDHSDELKKLEEDMKVMEQKMKGFEKELKKNLQEDGYLKEKESLRHMHWHDNGDIEINDIKIKPEHAKKYRELHSRYFDHEPHGFKYEE
jgi:hypothetical protein